MTDLPDPTDNAQVAAVWEGIRRTDEEPPELFDVVAQPGGELVAGGGVMMLWLTTTRDVVPPAATCLGCSGFRPARPTVRVPTAYAQALAGTGFLDRALARGVADGLQERLRPLGVELGRPVSLRLKMAIEPTIPNLQAALKRISLLHIFACRALTPFTLIEGIPCIIPCNNGTRSQEVVGAGSGGTFIHQPTRPRSFAR